MKVSLVVSQGVHAGKVIPITSAQFLIGRDPHCNLRPSSPAISKQHAGIFVRGGKVFLKDYGSTNGSFVNDEQVVDEREVKNDDQLKIGPLAFVLHVDVSAPAVAVKPAGTKPAAAPATPTPSPVVSVPARVSVASAPSTEEQSEDQLAAMLLMDDAVVQAGEQTAEQSIPDGTTVVEIPAIPDDPKKAADMLQKVKEAARNNSDAAGDLLRKYMNRPRT